jgi:predicted transcriptional regulator
MTNAKSAVLLSVKPRFADAILSGNKTAEVRRRSFDARPGAAVVLYASTPTKAIVGTARLSHAVSMPPAEAWQCYGETTGITREEFDAYLLGVSTAVLLLLRNPQRLNEPISLEELRSDVGRFQPPQSYRYIAPGDPAPLRELVSAA